MQFRQSDKSKPQRSLQLRLSNLRSLFKSNLLQQIVYVCTVSIALWLVCMKLYSEVGAARLAQTVL